MCFCFTKTLAKEGAGPLLELPQPAPDGVAETAGGGCDGAAEIGV